MNSKWPSTVAVVLRRSRVGKAIAAALVCLAVAGSCATVSAQGGAPVAAVAVDATAANPTDPKRPFIMPAQKSDVAEALDDFRRYSERGTWERAFKSLEKVLEAPPDALTAGQDGLLMPTRLLVRQLLAGLPADGKQAYRLFHDAEARLLVEQATGQDEIEKLKKVFSTYFITSVGDVAADRLGDIYFELGEMDKAAECWQAVLRFHPETRLPRVRLLTKSAIALARADRWEAFDQVERQVAERHGGETVVLGGREVVANEHLKTLAASRGDVGDTTVDDDGAPARTDLSLPAGNDPAWQFRMLAQADAQTLANIGRNWGWGQMPISQMVPPAVADKSRIYVNLLGYHFALDVNTGKLLWRSAPFHDLIQKVQQNQFQPFQSAEQFSIAVSGERLWSVYRDPTQPGTPFRLGRWDAATGKELWNSQGVGELQQWNMMGVPAPSGERVYVCAGKQGQGAELHLLALAAEDGKLVWSTLLGTHQVDPNQMYNQRSSQPALVLHGGRVYVETHAGAILAVDADSGALEWGFAYDSEMPDTNYWYYQAQKLLTASRPLIQDQTLYAKGMRSSRLCAIDLAGPSLLWQRPVSQSALLVGCDGQSLYFGGEELTAIDLSTRRLKWATRAPTATGWLRPLMTPNRVYQFTPRGVFEFDKATGDVLRRFRGSDLDSRGGALLMTPQALITVSNLAVTAYRLDGSELAQPGGP